MNLGPHIEKILKTRYFDKKAGENSWESLCERVATAAAEAEETKLDQQKYYFKFYNDLLYPRVFMPNSPTWMNAGLTDKGTLSACFVIPLEDTMESILESSRLSGMISKYGGGTGFSFSKLRPKGSKIKTTHGQAMGPVGVLKYLAATSQMVTQGGKRQGANMGVLDVYHKDILDFINIKQKESEYLLSSPVEFAQHKLNNGDWDKEKAEDYVEYCKTAGLFQLFNISIAVDKKFMRAVEQYEKWKLDCSSAVGEPWTEELDCGKTIGEIWDIIINMAWESGDPGLLFLERVRAFSKTQSPYPINATNPCGEQSLPDGGSCNLGSIDLSKCVRRGKDIGEYEFDAEYFTKIIHLSVRFLDNIVTVNNHADKLVDEVNVNERRIGLGIMGWADTLLKLKIPYDSEKAIKTIHLIGEIFKREALNASIDLAKERGEYPLWDLVKNNEIDTESADLPYEYNRIDQERLPRRNCSLTCVAPTGTISLVAGCSSGIEPHFNHGYVHQGLKEHGGLGLIYASEYIEYLANINYTDYLPEKRLELVVDTLRAHNWKPANEIDVKWHIKHQGAWQKYVDNAISKTINLPNSATKKDVASSYVQAYLEGCRGTTIYRDGCKPFQVLNTPEPKEEEKDDSEATQSDIEQIDSIDHDGDCLPDTNGRKYLPDDVHTIRKRVATSQGNLYIHIGYDSFSKMPVETFITLGNAGSEVSSYCNAIGKLVSEMLRSRIHPLRIIKQLRGIKSTPYGFGKEQILSVPDAIGIALQDYMKQTFGDNWIEISNSEHKVKIDNTKQSKITFEFKDVMTCPDCGSEALEQSEGCKTCRICGYSKCS